MNKIVNGVEVEMTPEEITAWETSQPTLAEVISTKLTSLDEYRWKMEIGGIAFGGGVIRTDGNSQAKIAAAYFSAKADPSYNIPTWEVVPGEFISLDNATIIAMGEAVRNHVQDTFNRKATLHLAINALETTEAVQSYDIASEWDALE